jgi:hypothetical protein
LVKRTLPRVSAKSVEGARASEMPGFIKPQLATLTSKAPVGDHWLHEIKYSTAYLTVTTGVSVCSAESRARLQTAT